jgi:aquaporin Z
MSAKYFGEFLGTYMLVLTVGFCVLSGTAGAWAVTAIACSLMVMIYALGGVSGANFNPAVSLALVMAGKMELGEALPYMVIQILAGILAGISYGFCMWQVFDGGPAHGHTWGQAALAEIIYTFMLCFVVLNVAVSKDAPNQYFGLAIGFVVIAGGYGAGGISGGCFNPAVAFGIDVSSFGMNFAYWSFYYAIFEFVGAALAAVLFNIIRCHEAGVDGPGLLAKLLSEFLGTFMLVLTVGLNVLGGSKAPVWSIAASLMCMIFALGSISGANFNPAVTLCLALTGRAKVMDWATVPLYWVAQILGGIAAGYTYTYMSAGSFGLAPGKGYGIEQAAFAEIVFTFMLCYVVCTVATVDDGKLDQYFGLAIGSCVTAGGYAIGAISGGSLNPAVSIGISVSHASYAGEPFGAALAYCLFEFVGAGIAAGLFMFTHAHDGSFIKRTQ